MKASEAYAARQMDNARKGEGVIIACESEEDTEKHKTPTLRQAANLPYRL